MNEENCIKVTILIPCLNDGSKIRTEIEEPIGSMIPKDKLGKIIAQVGYDMAHDKGNVIGGIQ